MAPMANDESSERKENGSQGKSNEKTKSKPTTASANDERKENGSQGKSNEKTKSKPRTASANDAKAAKLDELQAKLERLQSMLTGFEEEVKERAREDAGAAHLDPVCNSCLVRKKGAALLPCGHTFCWKCTSDLRKGRGPCPSCNCSFWNVVSVNEVP